MEESQRTQIEAKMEKYDHVFKEMERLYKEMLSVHHELSHEEVKSMGLLLLMNNRGGSLRKFVKA
mgnify:FL=1